METLAFTFVTTGVTVKVYATETSTGVDFRFETTLDAGYRVDLNGFFLDVGVDGGSVYWVGTKSNNMNGGTNDGYDKAVVLGSVGGNDADYGAGTVSIDGITLADLVGSDAGLRATSYGLDGSGSLKLVADYMPPPPPPADDFPTWPQDISNVVLYFSETDGSSLDTKPKGGDGFVLVKIDDVPGSADDDLDHWIDQALAKISADHPELNADTLLGAAIKGGTQTTQFFAYGDNNTNGTAADPIPMGAPDIETPPAQGQVPGSEIDLSYLYTDLAIV